MLSNGATGTNTPMTLAILFAPRAYEPKIPARSREYLVKASSRNIRILNLLKTIVVVLYKMIAKQAEISGQKIQVETIFDRAPRSVTDPENKFQPIIAPTIACEVETGNRAKVIR